MKWDDKLMPGTTTYEIVVSDNKYLRVIAGPGTGKSFAVKRRVAKLLEEGIEPSKILPVTFTRVAAGDLHRELVGMGVPRCEEMEGITLHSLALKVLMRQHVFAQNGRTARPLNKFELRPLEQDLSSCHGGVLEVREQITAYEAAWARLQGDAPGLPQSSQDTKFKKDLQGWLIFHQGMLIGEVIPYLYDYLVRNPVAEELKEYTHILVDEYQDLNSVEQGIISLLSNESMTCIVGDDDQSIYGFRYAHPEGIRNWKQQHPDADDLTIDDCYRCPTTVVEMANSLIAENTNRLEPRDLNPMSQNGPGDVQIAQYISLDDEVEGIAKKVSGLIDSGTPAGDILILAQRRIIGTPIYKRLLQLDVPVRSYYAEAELDTEEVQESFTYLKLFVSQEDKVALRWLLGKNSSTWLTGSYKRLQSYCVENDLSPWDALSQISDGLIKVDYTASLVERFGCIREEVSRLQDVACQDGMQGVIDDLFSDGDEGMEEIKDLAMRILEIETDIDPSSFVQNLTTAIAKPEIPSEVQDVRIMSLHKSKGLSVPVTIIAGCVEGLLPKQPDEKLPLKERDALLEEQRRLFFVGITRVKAAPQRGIPGTLMLTCCRSMPLSLAKRADISVDRVCNNGATAVLQASRFIQELGANAPRTTTGLK